MKFSIKNIIFIEEADTCYIENCFWISTNIQSNEISMISKQTKHLLKKCNSVEFYFLTVISEYKARIKFFFEVQSKINLMKSENNIAYSNWNIKTIFFILMQIKHI